MAFIRHKGKTKFMWLKKSDTTREIRDGGLVKINDSGSIAPCQNDSTDHAVMGVARANDTVTDTAFSDGSAGSRPGFIPVEVPVERFVEWLIDVDSDGGAADSDVGRHISVDTTGGNSVLAGDSAGMRVDISDSAVPQVLVTGRISATRIIGVIALQGDATSFDT